MTILCAGGLLQQQGDLRLGRGAAQGNPRHPGRGVHERRQGHRQDVPGGDGSEAGATQALHQSKGRAAARTRVTHVCATSETDLHMLESLEHTE